MLEGKITDYGDLIHQERWIVKGRRLKLIWRIGTPIKTTGADRVRGQGSSSFPGKADVIMDLQADKKVTLTATFTDEIGNPVPTPVGGNVVFSVDDPAIINLTDNGDGTAVAAATGDLGPANVHLEATLNGQIVTGDLQIVVVAGLAERVTITPGEPEEVTPDGA